MTMVATGKIRTARERSYAEQRVTDVRDALEQQLSQLRTDLGQARPKQKFFFESISLG